jgi:hypothetical protein
VIFIKYVLHIKSVILYFLLIDQYVRCIGRYEVLFELLILAFKTELRDMLVVELQPHERFALFPTVKYVVPAQRIPTNMTYETK